MKFRELTSQEIIDAADEINQTVNREKWRSFIKSIYGEDAVSARIETESQYNDEGYDNVISSIVVRDIHGRRIGPIPVKWIEVATEGKRNSKFAYRYFNEKRAAEQLEEDFEDFEDDVRRAARYEVGVESLGTINIALNEPPKRKFYELVEGNDTVMFLSADDWFGVYVNGVLCGQNHTIRGVEWKYIFEKLGCKFEWNSIDDEWLENQGHLPDQLSEIPSSKITSD